MLRRKREIKNFLRNVRDSVFYRMSRVDSDPSCLDKIVFVCKGNICRSVFAEYLLQGKGQNGGAISIDSCGLMVGKSEPSPLEARSMAKTFGLDLEGHLSKGWQSCDLAKADLILAMEFWQFKMLVELLPDKRKNIKLLREFTPFPENLLCNIDDPFGQGEDIFEKCFKQIERAVANLNSKQMLLRKT